MNLPAPFQLQFAQWEQEGIKVLQADWTTPQKRHVGAWVEYDGELCFAKLALPWEKDLDERYRLSGMQREVWWSETIQGLRQRYDTFPFRSPRVLHTNVTQYPFADPVAWVIMEFIDGKPIAKLETKGSDPIKSMEEDLRFKEFSAVAVSALLALEKIQAGSYEEPDFPPAPHGVRRWLKVGLLDMKTAVLGNGAFEVENFWHTTDGDIVLLDNEFAWWYPRYDHLSYLYHRLYCNAMRPDLANHLLCEYLSQCPRGIFERDHGTGSSGDKNLRSYAPSEAQFFADFAQLLKPRLLSGWYNDLVRRGHMPWHKKQRLRYKLGWALLWRNYNALTKVLY